MIQKPCPDCGELHLRVLHAVAKNPELLHSHHKAYFSLVQTFRRVLLKVVPVLLWNVHVSLSTYTILNDGSVQSMILPAAIKQHQLKEENEVPHSAGLYRRGDQSYRSNIFEALIPLFKRDPHSASQENPPCCFAWLSRPSSDHRLPL